MYDHRNFYRAYLKILGTEDYILSAFEELWCNNPYDRFWDPSVTKEHMYHAFYYFVSGCLGLLLFWLSDDNRCDKSLVAKELDSFIPDILKMRSSIQQNTLDGAAQ